MFHHLHTQAPLLQEQSPQDIAEKSLAAVLPQMPVIKLLCQNRLHFLPLDRTPNNAGLSGFCFLSSIFFIFFLVTNFRRLQCSNKRLTAARYLVTIAIGLPIIFLIFMFNAQAWTYDACLPDGTSAMGRSSIFFTASPGDVVVGGVIWSWVAGFARWWNEEAEEGDLEEGYIGAIRLEEGDGAQSPPKTPTTSYRDVDREDTEAIRSTSLVDNEGPLRLSFVRPDSLDSCGDLEGRNPPADH